MICARAGCDNKHENEAYCSRFCQRYDNLNSNVAEDATRAPSAPSAQPGEQQFKKHSDGTATVRRCVKERVTTLEELIEVMEIDLEQWEIEWWDANKWDMGYKDADGDARHYPLFQVKAKLKPRQNLVDSLAIIDAATAEMQEHSPTAYHDYEYTGSGRATEEHMYEINISDLHLGALAWGVETYGGDYDSQIAETLFRWAVQDLLDKAASFHIDKFLLPLGNDIFHSDRTNQGSGGATTHGTSVDVDTRRQKMFATVRDMVIDAVDHLVNIAPVEIVIVPGNHDSETSKMLGEVLNAWYRNVDAVEIDKALAKPRKYRRYGNTMLGFTHGQHESMKRLPMLMAKETEDFSDARFHEWHIGHKHSKGRRDVISVREEQGVRIRTFPSLASPDAWHNLKGFTMAVRSAEAFLWNRRSGFAGMFASNARSRENV